MSESSESKTKEATPRRLQQAREEGMSASGGELPAAVSLLAGLSAIFGTASWATEHIVAFQRAIERMLVAPSAAGLPGLLTEGLALVLQISLIPLGVAAVAQLVVIRLQTGPVLSMQPVMPRLDRLNPVAGLTRLASMRSLLHLAMMTARSVVVALSAALVVKSTLGDALRLSYANASAAIAVASLALVQLTLWGVGAFLVLALIDTAVQRWQFLKDLRMTATEFKREQRNTQGDPALRARRWQFFLDASPQEQKSMLDAAALAIHDEQGRALVFLHQPPRIPSPLCLLKASGGFAEEVMQRLRDLGTPVVQDDALVDALFAILHPGAPIPQRWEADLQALTGSGARS